MFFKRVYLHVMIPYFLSEKYTKKRKICVAGPPRSLFGPVSMFSGLTPFPPIRDGRIPQFVKPWLYSSSKMIPRCKEDHKISIRELYDFLLVFFASYWKRWTMRRSCRCPLWGFKNYQMQLCVIWCFFCLHEYTDVRVWVILVSKEGKRGREYWAN